MAMRTFDAEQARQAFEMRDRAFDGRFVVAVLTTRIYCKPSCPARRPRPENVRFFPSNSEAAAKGFRPCLRCRPDEVARDRRAIADAVRIIEGSEEPPSLARLAAQVGYAPHHFQRIFTRNLGISPAGYARALRARRAAEALEQSATITGAIYEAGYSGPGRFYADTKERLGMTPSAWRDGGRGVTIRWTIVESGLGPLLIAATEKGICRITFDESADKLRSIFPNANLLEDDGALSATVESVIAAIDSPADAPELPLDVCGTAFQEAVWQQLRKIPPGETRSYAQIAAAIGQPGAVRAVGSANGSNPVSILVPCHRVVRSDGSLGGYAGGLDRKRRLLESEGVGGAAEQAQLDL